MESAPTPKCAKLHKALRKAGGAEAWQPSAFGGKVWTAQLRVFKCEAAKGGRCVAVAKELDACHKSLMGTGMYTPLRGGPAQSDCDQQVAAMLACAEEITQT
uniref:Uncharacterized protein n=1 Tax=Phaeomonas parva TaxID=124430 RepID=A0A7S1U2F9_9STRA|mmetsp:Transcript_25840/g.80921  ORF Transcript_25840/g.80921 Transcript_25840/m.80921 type:complete len:102 (+) Transcript_25840:121-426(+)